MISFPAPAVERRARLLYTLYRLPRKVSESWHQLSTTPMADGGFSLSRRAGHGRRFEAVWDEAKEGEVRIFSRYTDVRMNLRTQFNRWIIRNPSAY